MPKGERWRKRERCRQKGSMLIGGAWVFVINDKGGDCWWNCHWCQHELDVIDATTLLKMLKTQLMMQKTLEMVLKSWSIYLFYADHWNEMYGTNGAACWSWCGDIDLFFLGTAIHFLFPYNWNWKISLLLGGLLSATDPVAVVALLKELALARNWIRLLKESLWWMMGQLSLSIGFSLKWFKVTLSTWQKW